MFATANSRVIAEAQDFGSARCFRVNDPPAEAAWVLDYGWRALLDKGFLSAAPPDNSLLDALDDERRRRSPGGSASATAVPLYLTMTTR